MSSKIIDYDLRDPGRDYESLHEMIKEFDVWAHITESTWFVKTNLTCEELRDKLLQVMDPNDRIFVGELTGTAAWHKVICKSEYLKEHL